MDPLVYEVSKITVAQIIRKALTAIGDGELKTAERELADAITVLQRMQGDAEAQAAA